MADITVLVQSPGSEYWGQSTWGSNDFGGSGISLTTSSGTATTTADANVTVSGISLTSSVGAASGFASFSTSVTGVSSSISQGSVVPGTGDIVNLTTAGLLQTAIGNETAEGIIEVGWGGDAWNVNAWGQLQPFENVTGQALATSIGSTTVTANADVSVTGQSLTTSIGTEVVDIGVPVTGIAASTSSGSVTIDDTFLIGEGWGRDTYGNLAWGVNYSAKNNTGLSLTSSIGSESSFTDVTVSVTGQALGMTFGVYSVTANADLSITVAEHTMTSSLGSTSLTQTTTETLTGQSLTTSVGNAPAGLFLDVPVTGTSLTTSQGTTSLTQTTTEPVTGQSLTTSIGTITQVPQVIVGVSGLSLTSAMGEEGTQANARVVPTGQSLTSSINSVNVTPWQEVDLGVNNTWQDAA